MLLSSLAIGAICLTPKAAHAQAAEVPKPDAKGDFRTARVLGNRGYYPNTYWLVTDVNRLNCRTAPNGAMSLRLEPGEVVTAVFPNKQDAIVLDKGTPWLRIKPIPALPRRASNPCFVRANLRYIAPINADFADALIKMP